MKIITINKIKSREFEQVIALGDANTKTLGFLPKVVFEEYAKLNQLVGVISDNNEILGYLLYRISNDKVTIVHLCIKTEMRGKGIAHLLVSFLKDSTKKYQGIRLSCRNDYRINRVWEKFNFIPMNEKPGRSKKKLPLTVWWFQHEHNDLFSQIIEFNLKNKIAAVIDMNIFIDLIEKRNNESLALESGWIQNEVEFFITREINIEVNRKDDPIIKRKNRSYIQNFNSLPFNENFYLEVFNELQNEFMLTSENDISDLKHIAYTISGGAEYFITRDDFILKNAKQFKNYGITILRPSDFIIQLDEIFNKTKYYPKQLIGTKIVQSAISAIHVNDIIDKFLFVNERKTEFRKKINELLADPENIDAITINQENDFLAFVILDKRDNDKLVVPVLRMFKNHFKGTLIKFIIFQIINISIKERKKIIEINDTFLGIDFENALKEIRFFKVNDKWFKINYYGVLSYNDVVAFINTLLIKNDTLEKEVAHKLYDEISEIILDENIYNCERSLFPLKIKDQEIPCFIIPIKPHWAEALFDDHSYEVLPFFEPEYHLLMNSENVYYRSAFPNILKAPSRILWYVSKDPNTKSKGYIRACSYIDLIFIDNPNILFKKFEQLGIYKWKDIRDMSKGKENVMAFLFSDTELFKKNISLKSINNQFSKTENKKFMVASPIEIRNETFVDFYTAGMQI